MSCLCHKLRTRRYDNITQSEAELLKRTWSEAPYVFQANPHSPPEIEDAVVQQKRSACNSTSSKRKHPDQPSPAVSALVATYSYEKAARFLEGGNGLNIQGAGGLFVRVFLAIERSDPTVEIHQLLRRACSYVFAQLHNKGTSVEYIVQEIENELPHSQQTRTKVYHILRIGNKWIEIVKQFGLIVKQTGQELTGLLCLFEIPSAWERASHEVRHSALTVLSETTDIKEKTSQLTPLVDKVLDQIRLEQSFVDETHRAISLPKPPFDRYPLSQLNRGLEPGVASMYRAFHNASKAEPSWKAPSLEAASRAIPGSSHTHSEDANILLTFLAFFAAAEIPLDLLFRGATPRGRWTIQGEIEESDAVRVGLAPELGSLLSDRQRLASAFNELSQLSAVSKNSDQAYTLSEAVSCRVRENLSPDLLTFWRCQALVVAYRAIPWKYIESAICTKLFLPHLEYALKAFQERFEDIPASTRTDLALTLIEASRFPNMAWKRFAVAEAEVAARGLDDWYLYCCIAQSQCLLSRIAGKIDRAVSGLSQCGQPSMLDTRISAANGQAVIQRSLNCIQVEDLSTAKRHLQDWNPQGRSSSPMEDVVVFRRDLMLGRILRYQGDFTESMAQLEMARKTADRRNDLIFEEDLRDLTCELADTLRELEDPTSAEHYLRTEISRRKHVSNFSSGGSLLELSLAEALFAQNRFEEAESLCLDVQSRPNLLKLERLRLQITLAKICHVNFRHADAFPHWNAAFQTIEKFHMTNGRTTRIILLSICDTLRCLGYTELLRNSLNEVSTLDGLAKPGGIQYWIAGLRHWLEYVYSRESLSRM